MATPEIPLILKKLLSLDTPIAMRVFEIALVLGLIVAASYVKLHVKDQMVEFAATSVGMIGAMIVFLMLFGLLGTLFVEASKSFKKPK